MNKSVWVVTADGCTEYGAEIYLIGVFNTEESAKAYEGSIINKFGRCPYPIKITKMDMDIPFNLEWNDAIENWGNDYYLGGYVE